MNARLYILYSLVFFLWVIIPACQNHDNRKMELIWQGDKAVAIAIPAHLIKDTHKLKVALAGKVTKAGILGDFIAGGDTLRFQPLIPLSPGLSYAIWEGGDLIGSVSVPTNTGKAPQLVTIYPQADTLPENLLKFYFHFSHPMRTGQVLQHVYMLDKNRDTMRNVFLNLQPELWDETGTTLTLWLDPGRIKRDLVLNRELGNPLKKAQAYQLVVDSNWKDTRGIKLGKPYTKHFVAGDRDGEIPNINNWQLTIPKAGSDEPLIIKTNQPLDHYLLQECVAILDNKGKMLYSQNIASDNDKTLKMIPLPEWQPGKYRLLVKANLEDLAGNNLNRVFDRDIHIDKQQNKVFFERVFKVKK